MTLVIFISKKLISDEQANKPEIDSQAAGGKEGLSQQPSNSAGNYEIQGIV